MQLGEVNGDIGDTHDTRNMKKNTYVLQRYTLYKGTFRKSTVSLFYLPPYRYH